MSVERHPGHLGLGDHPVDADRPDPLAVEQAVGGGEDAGARRRGRRGTADAGS